jgi:hypothetical protein
VSHLAAFASSDAGKAYARIEQHYGRDPAAPLDEIDDVLAHNLRAAFIHTLAPEPEDDDHAAAVERAKAGGRAIRKALNA